MSSPTHSAIVAEALIRFALEPVSDRGSEAVIAAVEALAWARTLLGAAQDERRLMAARLEAQGDLQDTLRGQAWVIGAVLAEQAPQDLSTAVLAAVLAVGDELEVSGLAMAAALAVGTEAAARILAAVDCPEFRARGGITSRIGVLAATLAIARLYRLDQARTRHALGLAVIQAASFAHHPDPELDAIEIGRAGAGAIEAARRAKHEIGNLAEASDGSWDATFLMAHRFDAGMLLNNLGTHWVSLN